ncbi:MAG: CHAT domain-containing protein, partial [Actinomycetota bacterium]
QGQGKVVLERLEDASMAALQRALRKGEYHVFHFIGHGGFDPSTNEGVVAFEDGGGLRKLVSAQLLGTWLNDSPSLRLAVLNACEGAKTAAQNPFAGVAQRLLRRGIPAVIAMQFEISDGAALAFSSAFYEAVADGYPIDASVAEARKTILGMSAVEWGTPVLYMRSEDGRVFDLGAAGPVAPVGGVEGEPSLEASDPSPATAGRVARLIERARELWATAVAEPDERARIQRFQESHDLLVEARKAEPGSTEVLLMTAQVLVDLTPDDPQDERRLLEAIRRLLEAPKDDAERFRLGVALFTLASTHAGAADPAGFEEPLREARAIFEALGRADMIRRCDALRDRIANVAVEGRTGEAADAAPVVASPDASRSLPAAPPPAPSATTAGVGMPTPQPALGPLQPVQGPINLLGRWQIQDADGSVVVLDLFPNGMFQGIGRIVTMQFAGDVHLAGQWGFEPMSGVLQLQGFVNGMLPFAIAGAIRGRQGDAYVGIDQEGQAFTLTPAS